MTRPNASSSDMLPLSGVSVLRQHLPVGCLIVLLLCSARPVLVQGGEQRGPGTPAAQSDRDEEALKLGHRVLAVKAAIQNPASPSAMDAILELGTDSRYYVMVRGWLSMQLQADLSILHASRGNPPAGIEARVEFLENAIRAIDLE